MKCLLSECDLWSVSKVDDQEQKANDCVEYDVAQNDLVTELGKQIWFFILFAFLRHLHNFGVLASIDDHSEDPEGCLDD